MGRLVAVRMAAKPLVSCQAPGHPGWGVVHAHGGSGVARCLRAPLPGLRAPSQTCSQTCCGLPHPDAPGPSLPKRCRRGYLKPSSPELTRRGGQTLKWGASRAAWSAWRLVGHPTALLPAVPSRLRPAFPGVGWARLCGHWRPAGPRGRVPAPPPPGSTSTGRGVLAGPGFCRRRLQCLLAPEPLTPLDGSSAAQRRPRGHAGKGSRL